MIIVEGMDNSGKSTLIANIADRFELRVIKRSGPPSAAVTVAVSHREAEQAFILETLSFLVLNPQMIYDRFPIISEGIYGPVLRNKNVFEREGTGWENWLDRLVQCNPLIIYCRPPEEKILCFSPNREQMQGVTDSARLLIHKYDQLMDKLEKRGALLVRHDFTRLVDRVPIEMAVSQYLNVSQYLKIQGGAR